MIYLDNNASVPLRPCARDALMEALGCEGNASSPHATGRKLRARIDRARKNILERLDAKRLVFTSGGTEANALALSGVGDVPVLISSIEHDSVLKAVPSPSFVAVTTEGCVDLQDLEKKLASFANPGLLSLMLVNNETGVIQPIPEAARLAHAKGWMIHTDASQALGHIPLSFEELGVDMLTISSHKCGGPVGVGALVLKEDLHLQPLIRGGGQEYGMRSGTLPTALICGFEAALTEALHDQPLLSKRLRGYQQKIESDLPEAIIHGKASPRVPPVVCLSMPGAPSELQLMAFDLKGIAVSAGSACSSGKMKESHVLAAMGISPEKAQCALRVSMGWKTKGEEVETFIQAWRDIFLTQRLKEAS